MSNTKIVIDKEQIDKLDAEIIELEKSLKSSKSIGAKMMYSDVIKGIENAKKILLEYATEIQIDQSIEERAEKYGCGFTLPKVGYIEGATQQQIIEQLKVKEKDCKPSPIDYYKNGFEEEKDPSFD